MKTKILLKFSIAWIVSYFVLFMIWGIYLYSTRPDVSYLKRFHPTRKELTALRQQHFHETFKRPIRYQWIPLSQIPRLLQRTIILAEDASFYIHHGIDWYEVKASFQKNWKSGKFLRGGSTITQQLAKNLFLSREKSVKRKLREWIIARELEKKLRKSRILELYLNIVEWGKGMFGIKAASRFYFKKEPQQLTLDEMVRLAAVLPNPKRMQPNRVDYSVLWRSKVILKRLYHFGDISKEAYQQTLQRLEELYQRK